MSRRCQVACPDQHCCSNTPSVIPNSPAVFTLPGVGSRTYIPREEADRMSIVAKVVEVITTESKNVVSCDGPGCDKQIDEVYWHQSFPHGWMTLATGVSRSVPKMMHFCSVQHLAEWLKIAMVRVREEERHKTPSSTDLLPYG